MKKKYLFLSIVIIGFSVIFLGVLGVLYENNRQDKQANNVPNETMEPTPSPIENNSAEEKSLALFRDLYHNDDIIASIVIPSIELEELVVKGNDNDFYLNHNIQKNKDINGAIFMDYRTINVDFAKQINIYGHNSDSQDIPFGNLEKYQDENFFNNNLDLVLKTDQGNYSYKIFAASLEPKSYDEHMIISYEGEDFVNHVQRMRENALFDSNEQVTQNDQILVLQTCLFNPKQFLILYAKKVG